MAKRRRPYSIPPGIVWLRQKTTTPEKMSQVIDDLCLLDKSLGPLSPAKILQIEKDLMHSSVTFAEVQTYLFFNHQKMKSVGFKEENTRRVRNMIAQQEYISNNDIANVTLYYRMGLSVENVNISMELEGDSKGIVSAVVELLDERIEALRQEQAFLEEKKKQAP